jgi:hypothetical protein
MSRALARRSKTALQIPGCDELSLKIRHCQDINGVLRQLPLFEPPIEPGLLVQAAAQGLSLSSVLNDLNSPMPNYRFEYLLQKALELCTEVKALGNAFLSTKEKGDAEAMARLRAKHESSIQNLVMEVKKQQLDEANSGRGNARISKHEYDKAMSWGTPSSELRSFRTDYGANCRLPPIISE